MRPSIARSVDAAARARTLVTQRPRDDRLTHRVLTPSSDQPLRALAYMSDTGEMPLASNNAAPLTQDEQ